MSIELRQHERLAIGYTVTLRLLGIKQSDNKTTITNISQAGLCFVSTLHLLPEEKVEIDLPSTRLVATLKAKVIWCRPQRDEFSTGAEFVEMSAARRARLFEMHKAIKIYQEMKDSPGNPQQATAEWLALHAEKFLADVP